MRICKRCIMSDQSDPTIKFDSEGYCNYCSKTIRAINTTIYFPNEEGKRRLNDMIAVVKKEGEGKEVCEEYEYIGKEYVHSDTLKDCSAFVKPFA